MSSPFKKLAIRRWPSIRDYWLAHLPTIDFANLYPEPMLWELPGFDTSLGAAKTEGILAYLPGVREAIFREAIVLARKLLYCWSIARASAADGRQTWTAVAAYEASFYGAKAFCYLHGFASLGRDSKFYLNAFHETVLKRRKQQIVELNMELYNLHSRLEHSTLWGITDRLLSTTIFEPALGSVQAALKQINWHRFSHFRNQIMYVGGFWPLHDTYCACDIANNFCHPEIVKALDVTQASSPPFSAEYFEAAKLMRRALYLMISDIASLAPALLVEAEALSA